MNANEPTAEEIREALDGGIHCCELNGWDSSVVLVYLRDVLLADPGRVRALLALTHDDLQVGFAWSPIYSPCMRRFIAARDLHPDAKGGAK